MFNTGFPNQKSFILLYLIKWQYFWWFWFSSLFFFYYNLVFNKLLLQSIRQNPKIATTQKAHGKWGDVIICLLPVFWCVNILTSSNSLMKSIEWQTESYLMAVRVRAKQWYWTYKISLEDVTRLLNSNLIIGSGKVISNIEGNSISNFYSINNFIGDSQVNRNSSTLNRGNDIIFLNNNKLTGSSNVFDILGTKKTPFVFTSAQFKKANSFFLNPKNSDTGFVKYINRKGNLVSSNYTLTEFLNKGYKSFLFSNFIYLSNTSNHLPSSHSLNTSSKKFLISSLGDSLKPVSSLKLPFNFDFPEQPITYVFSSSKVIASSHATKTTLWSRKDKSIYFFSIEKNPVKSSKEPLLRFVDNIHSKERFRRYYLTIKQTRGFISNGISSNSEGIPIVSKYSVKPLDTLKIANSKSSSHSLMHNQRLLEVDNLLVLPTHTGLTIITNSYDVVHSWFVPGLGLKMDCVPGRSTHHSLYVRTPGFYYGQCAEICGRLHHHMPIRVCFLPLEHFFVWWNHFYSKYLKTPNSVYYRLF